MPIQISYLADYTECIAKVGQWYQQEWETLYTPDTFSGWFDVAVERANYSSLPLAFVAHREGQILGAAGLDAEALPPELNHLPGPWLNGLFAEPGERKQDVQNMLVRQVLETARLFGYPHVRSTCRVKHERFNYGGNAWRHEETIVLGGRELHILKMDLA